VIAVAADDASDSNGCVAREGDLPLPAASPRVGQQRMLDLLNQVRHISLSPPDDITEMLRELNRATVAAVPGAQSAGITVVGPHRDVRTLAATGPHPGLLDDVQRETGEGPCLSAAWDHHTIRIDDVFTDERWKLFRAAATERTPVRSVLSFVLFEDGKTMAALNLFSQLPHAFPNESTEVGLIYATHTVVAWNMVRREGQFRSALASRDVIGQAKGILMERFDIDAHRAFELLKKLSQDSNTHLADLAEQLVQKRSALGDLGSN
jgi:putative methionine-R-sulfoxide reductase with GAF domain